ncbi:MAG: DUF169 domain-containing protein [Dehalococcoidales bacterium]|nr:DUF169 domain-containing protein [Dehalococcoidales bacterium]
MTTLKEFNKYGEDLERLLILRTSPLAVKMLEKDSDIPEGAVRPWKDRGIHIAQCQAFALSRRQKETIAMLKEDHWCFAALIAYGLVDKPEDPEFQRFLDFPTFPRDKYVGIVSAPLKTANFEPDVVVIYSNTSQLRNLLMPSHFIGEEEKLAYHFFPPACAYQVVPVMENGGMMVTLPDPGDYTRALAGEDEIILSVPKDKMEELVKGVRQMEEGDFGYAKAIMYMQGDFPHPPMYQTFFKRWGLYGEGKK